MVGPISDEERDAFAWKLKAGFILLVALSAGLITIQADAGPIWFLVSTVAGGFVGVVLVWIAFPERQQLVDSDGTDDDHDWGR